MDYDLAESLMDAGFPQIGKGRLIGPLNKLVWRSKVSGLMPRRDLLPTHVY
jgi:hypothetical protein